MSKYVDVQTIQEVFPKTSKFSPPASREGTVILYSGHDAEKVKPSAHDVHEMELLGIEPTFNRRFKMGAMIGFSSTVVLTWQTVLATFSFSLQNGGTGGYFFTYIFAMFAFGLTYLSLAELSSSYPTAGGQYQWVAQCAPRKFHVAISYSVGWLCTLAWTAYLAGCGVIIGNLVRDCVLIFHPDLTTIMSQWFPSSIAVVCVLIGGLFNSKLPKQFPALEILMTGVHFTSWVCFIAVLWATSTVGNPKQVLLTFNNGGGWSSSGGAALIGVLTSCTSLLGYDSAVHMSENAKDASRTIPLSLLTSYFINAAMGFVSGFTVILCAGDLQKVLQNETLAPFVTIFLNSTQSRVGTLIILVPIGMCFMAAQISSTATACRQTWAFARDDGLPFSHRLRNVPDGEVPQTALWTIISITLVMTSINFGSAIGFNALISLVSVSLTSSYVITISCLVWHRCKKGHLQQARFSLGRAGIYINIAALCTMTPITVLALFPPYAHVTAGNMNYAVVVFGAAILFSTSYYVLVGRKRFTPTLLKVMQ